MPYLHEWPVSKKHTGKLKCDQCGTEAEVQFLIQKKGDKKDYIKNYCSSCRYSMTEMYEKLTGCKKECLKKFCPQPTPTYSSPNQKSCS